MSTEPILAVSSLWADFGATPILQGADMTIANIAKGEIVILIGATASTRPRRCAA